MSNPGMPNLPGFGALADTMELVRNMWGGMGNVSTGLPGMVMPTLSIDEINKQISDLKAVESWLTLNMNMLRGTIQALEVQSATIATLKSMGQALGTAANASASASSSTQSMPSSSTQFMNPFGATAPTKSSSTTSSSVSKPFSTTKLASEKTSVSHTDAKNESNLKESTVKEQAYPTPLANPASWWNMLQDQFKHAVESAMASDPNIAKNKVKKSPEVPPKASLKSASSDSRKTTKASVNANAAISDDVTGIKSEGKGLKKNAGKTGAKLPGKASVKSTAKIAAKAPSGRR